MQTQEVTRVVGIDLSAACDTVDHGTLLLVKCCPHVIHIILETQKKAYLSVFQGDITSPILCTMQASTLRTIISSQSISGHANDHAIYRSFKTTPPDEESALPIKRNTSIPLSHGCQQIGSN